MNCTIRERSRCCWRTAAAGGCSRALARYAQSLGHWICVRRLVPQQTAQICLPSAGQPRRARRAPHRGKIIRALLYNPREIRRAHRNALCTGRRCMVRRESAVEFFKELVESALAHQGLDANELTSYYVVQLLANFVDRRSSNEDADNAPLA